MQNSLTTDKKTLNIGYVPLLDCAPLIVAQEAGFFAQEGLKVELHREQNWASIRDKLSLGIFDAAHMLAPMVIASAAISGKPFKTALSLGYNGNAITVSKDIYLHIAAASLDQTIAKLGEYINKTNKKLVFGTVFPYSMHTYLLNLLLEKAGVSKEDVSIRVIPPIHMVSEMKANNVDVFCVGEPWNTLAQMEDAGHILCYGNELWPYAPEKVLATHAEFTESHQDEYQKLLTALIKACRWLEEPDRIAQVALWMSAEPYLNCSSDLLIQAMIKQWHSQSQPNKTRKIFYSHHANAPWPAHAEWLLKSMIQLNQIPIEEYDACLATYDWNTYLSVMAELELEAPKKDSVPLPLPKN